MYLRTDTLSAIDRNTGTVYLLPEFKNAAQGSSGNAPVLARNVGRNFYITNPYSFSSYENYNYFSGKPVNIAGSYLLYSEEKNKSFLLEGIRDFTSWGAKSITELPYSASNAYWTKNVEKNTYYLIIEGATIDYDQASTKKDGDDLKVFLSNGKVFRLEGYYTTTKSFVYQPAFEDQNTNTTTTSTSATNKCTGNCQDGWGYYKYNNGDYYHGFWKNGQYNDYGMYVWKGLGKYIGTWVNGKMQGFGVYLADNNDNVVGNYRDGELNGLGWTVTGDEWKQGYYTNGKLTTMHNFFSTKSDSGCTAGDCQNKYGRYKWSNGDSFTGFFKNGKMHMGTYKFTTGDKYTGMFNSSNQFEGMGRFYFADGSYYGGNWKNGKYDGNGYYLDKDKKEKKGIWRNGQLVTPY